MDGTLSCAVDVDRIFGFAHIVLGRVYAVAPQPVSMLTADLPLGLPTLEEIQSACVRIGATDKTWDQYLCPTASYDSYDACEVSREFSDHYGVEIALCRRQRR